MEFPCSGCGSDLSVKRAGAKHFDRYTLLKVTTPVTAKSVFPHLRSCQGKVCGECLKKLRKVGKKDKKNRYRMAHTL